MKNFFSLSLVLITFAAFITGCGVDDAIADDSKQAASKSQRTNATATRQYSYASLGEKLVRIPQGWWVQQTHSDPAFFFVSEPEQRELYDQWIDFGYGLSFGDSACDYIKNLRPEMKVIKTFRKHDAEFSCAWDMEIENPQGTRYRRLAYATMPGRYFVNGQGRFASYSAPVADFERLEGAKVATMLIAGTTIAEESINRNGDYTIASQGGISRLAQDGLPAMIELPDLRLVPDGWEYRQKVFEGLELVSPQLDNPQAPLFMAFPITQEQRNAIGQLDLASILTKVTHDKGFENVQVLQSEETFNNSNFIGYSIVGNLEHIGREKSFVAFVDPSGAVFILVANREELMRFKGSALFVALVQGKSALLDLQLPLSAEGISSGIAQSLQPPFVPVNNATASNDELEKAFRDYDATRTMLNIIGGANGTNW